MGKVHEKGNGALSFLRQHQQTTGKMSIDCSNFVPSKCVSWQHWRNLLFVCTILSRWTLQWPKGREHQETSFLLKLECVFCLAQTTIVLVRALPPS